MKTKFTVILFISAFLVSAQITSQSVFQPDEWCGNFPNMPGSGAIWGHASCVLGDTIYVAGGSSSGGPSNSFYKFSISSNVWTTGNTLPDLKTGGDLVSCGTKIYYIGGGNTIINTGNAEQYVYNPATGVWSSIANIPTPITGNVAESYRDSLIYCMLGGWSTYETLIQVYNVNTNSWSQATAIPSGNGRRSFAGGILGNKLFVAAGFSSAFRNDFWVGTINPANPLQITWQQRTNLAIATSRPGGTALNGKFYVVMGEVAGGMANDSIAVWDTTASTWSYRDGKPVRTNNLYGSVAANITYCQGRPGVKIWCVGGSYGTQSIRPLDVYADTCLLYCTQPLTGINNNSTPVQYKLFQNYPNPFNPSTKISYQIPVAGNVKITISDILGREAAVLVNERMPAGTHEAVFEGKNFSSGVYFYRIESGEFSDSKKMILIK
jgi:hypothetical protein